MFYLLYFDPLPPSKGKITKPLKVQVHEILMTFTNVLLPLKYDMRSNYTFYKNIDNNKLKLRL